MKQFVDDAARQLVAGPGVGDVTAAMFIIAWSHPGACRFGAPTSDSLASLRYAEPQQELARAVVHRLADLEDHPRNATTLYTLT